MGGGTYSLASRSIRADNMGYATKSASEIFQQKNINNAMDPNGIVVREARDSKEHPNSLPIILALDVTGSMGSIPHFLVKNGLPTMMDTIIKAGVPDPQVLFMGIGDHEWDQAPLQVGQFESSDELLDKWLTDLWIEGNGGGNNGESYLLAWFFASRYTITDSLEKRDKKGILVTIGDEPTLKELPAKAQKHIMGDGQYSNITAAELLDKAREKYDVYHLHLNQGSNGTRQDVKDGWKQLMGDNVIYVQRREEVAQIISDLVTEREGTTDSSKKEAKSETKEEEVL
jgi:hypothetical protein